MICFLCEGNLGLTGGDSLLITLDVSGSHWVRVLDVMHIEKNVFENIFNTVMNVDGKTKDNAKSRLDLMEICRRPELHVDDGKLPKACYTLDKNGRNELCIWVQNLRFPDGYASNIARCVDMRKHKLFGMKSHDCHVFMQRLIPIAF